MGEMVSYVDGFLDAINVVERMLVRRGLYTKEIAEILETLRSAAIEKKMEKILLELGL